MDGIGQEIELDHHVVMAVEMCCSQRIAFKGSIGNIALGAYQTVPETDKPCPGAAGVLRPEGGMEDQ